MKTMTNRPMSAGVGTRLLLLLVILHWSLVISACGQAVQPVTRLTQLKGDVTITSPTTGQVIRFNGSKWVNSSTATLSKIIAPTDATSGIVFALASGIHIVSVFDTLNRRWGINTNLPATALHVYGYPGGAAIRVENAFGQAGPRLELKGKDAGLQHQIDFVSTGTADTGTAGQLQIRDMTLGQNLLLADAVSWQIFSPLKLSAYTVATLPVAATAGAGAVAFITDATAFSAHAVPTGGGSVKTTVFSDGTNWLMF